MSHLYPIATSATDAKSPDNPAALTHAEAERLAGDRPVIALETEWLTVSEEEAEAWLAAAEACPGHEFIQRYENEDGSPVLAITYWRISKTVTTAAAESADSNSAQPSSADDHTDDLYFKSGRTKKRGRFKKIDPRQMDLFRSPDKDA